MTPPPLRTILDLKVSETQLVEVGDPFLDVLLMFGRVEGEQQALQLPAARVEAEMFGGGKFEVLPFTAQVFVRRLATMAPACRYSPPLAGLVASLAGHNPAHAVLWAHAVAAQAARTGQPATVQALVLNAMDGALPTPQGMRALWDAQKVDRPQLKAARQLNGFASDNHLDYPTAWSTDVLKAGVGLSAG